MFDKDNISTKIKKIKGGRVVNVKKSISVPGGGRYGADLLDETNPVSAWYPYTGGGNIVTFNVLSKLPDGTDAHLDGGVKIQTILGDDETREYAICDLIKNTSDLSTTFYFQTEHLGKSGLICELPRNCLFRFVLEPQTGDQVVIEFVM